ncbi:IPI1/TEX10 family protein [Aspergillus mulundensis]|uniref:Pre-rRNA-processing protein n=1 Tax=Aspergillus mulundensis TaxID=1810919 RepID=A0A3D8RFK2_9EURO|nr:Pre-rRNA-processing protein ipi1 [Aspergillus mulundensis]RDW72654.1 Pre-rRNA-processing protein ipi1 [Aspergillus mulundensis]
MGNSAKRKKEKAKDFVKPKLKVGKAKAKPDNFTDTSFKSKAITLTQQSLTLSAPSTSSQFTHHLSLLTSKSDSQRRDSLAHLTTTLTSQPSHLPPPQPLSLMLPSLLPLILDSNAAVRANLLKLFRALPQADVADHVATLMPYIRAGMTHLAAEVRVSSVEVLGWLVSVVGEEVAGVAGGWVKTLNCFLSVLGWHVAAKSKWTSLATTGSSGSVTPAPKSTSSSSASGAGKATYGKAGAKGRPQVRFLSVLAEFLDAGIGSAPASAHSRSSSAMDMDTSDSEHENAYTSTFPITTFPSHLIPSSIASPYLTLNLFGAPRDEEGEMYETREDRWRVFVSRGFLGAVERGLEVARGEGGEVGRASALVGKVLRNARGELEGDGSEDEF